MGGSHNMRMRAAVLAFAAACLLPGSRAENRVYLKWDEENLQVSCVWEVDKVLSHWEKLEASPLQEEGFVVGKRCGVTLQIAGQRVDADQNKIVAAQYVTRGTEKHV
eukprot:Cvel_24203.t1-p1 / transcript=Cvel_24203.t1 / gene=Cvel_24203 / organism=Chromera_velia_CCMP2878 / gene_product=hypothetical protein / transcript_product=hypothetical protein / location=Cvel_scaffold2585:22747-25858(+) / protein_length=106 / sequence_SO=supercontig / SO=protein_coding / is_pseudo=false